MDNNYYAQMEAYNNMVTAKRDAFITARAKQEQEFEVWYNGLKKLPAEYLSRLSYDYQNLSMRDLVPEWYKAEPNQAIADEQVDKLNAMIQEANELYLEINKAGLELNKEFDRLRQGEGK